MTPRQFLTAALEGPHTAYFTSAEAAYRFRQRCYDVRRGERRRPEALGVSPWDEVVLRVRHFKRGGAYPWAVVARRANGDGPVEVKEE